MHSTYELVIDDDAGMTTIVPLLQAEISIGRKTGNFIKLSERNVSRHHARLRRAGNQLGIEDLGSYTGVLVNGQRIAAPTTIDAGDRVQIGDYHLALRRVVVAAATHRTGVEKKVPAVAPASRPPEALPAPRSQRAESRKLWGIALGAALTTMLCGGFYYRHAATPEVPERLAPPARAGQAAVRSRESLPQVTTPAKTRPARPANQDLVAPPAPPSVLTTRASRPEPLHHRPHVSPTGAASASAVATRTAEQAAELLAQAQLHYVNGEFAESIRIARSLKTSPGVEMTRAWRILGAAACKLGDFSLINEAYRHVDVVSRQYMTYVCQQAGVTLSSGRALPAR